MGVKEYELPKGRKAVFEFDENGVGKITLEAMDLLMGMVNIDLVRCEDCKHYDTESRAFPCCTDIFGAVRYMEADGFCSKGERKGE